MKMEDKFSSNMNPDKSMASADKSRSTERLKCNICYQKDGKYKCPKCRITYCSVVCFKSAKHKHYNKEPATQISKGIKKPENKNVIKKSKIILSKNVVEGLDNFSEATQRLFNGSASSMENIVEHIPNNQNADIGGAPITSNVKTFTSVSTPTADVFNADNKKVISNEQRQQNVSKMLNMLTLPQLQIQLLILNAIINEKKSYTPKTFHNFAEINKISDDVKINDINEDDKMEQDEKEPELPGYERDEEFDNPLIFSGSADDNPEARREIALKKLQSLRDGGDHHNELVEEFCQLFEQLESA